MEDCNIKILMYFFLPLHSAFKEPIVKNVRVKLSGYLKTQLSSSFTILTIFFKNKNVMQWKLTFSVWTNALKLYHYSAMTLPIRFSE